MKKNDFKISELETKNEILKIKSFGNYNIISRELHAENKIFLKTKKFPLLPEFAIFHEW